MNSTRICFSRITTTGILLGTILVSPSCRAVRQNRYESRKTTDTFSIDRSLSEIAIDTTITECRFKEIRITDFFPPDSSGPPFPVPRKQIVFRTGDERAEEKTRTIVKTETAATRLAERQENVRCESPGTDPLRWRYILYSLCMLSLAGSIWLIRKIGR